MMQLKDDSHHVHLISYLLSRTTVIGEVRKLLSTTSSFFYLTYGPHFLQHKVSKKMAGQN